MRSHSTTVCCWGSRSAIRTLPSRSDRVEVDDREIRMVGRKDVLEKAVLADGGPLPGVRSFVRKWRPVGELQGQEKSMH